MEESLFNYLWDKVRLIPSVKTIKNDKSDTSHRLQLLSRLSPAAAAPLVLIGKVALLHEHHCLAHLAPPDRQMKQRRHEEYHMRHLQSQAQDQRVHAIGYYVRR